MAFKKATKFESKLRLAVAGPSGAGKTMTSLAIASHLGGKVALIDTERGSASKYADLFDFDVLELTSFHPDRYIEAIHEAEAAGYGTLIIDSLSHAWTGKDGALELVDRAAKRQQSSNSFAAWREVTPLHNALVDAMVQSQIHVIATMRTKTAYSQDKDERTNKTVIRKLGLEPVQRDGMEYEFDVFADLDHDNNLIVQKSRCPELTGKIFLRAGQEVAEILCAWLTGTPLPPALKNAGTMNGTVPPPQSPHDRISEGQRKRLFALCKEYTVSHDDLKKWLGEKYRIVSTNDISKVQYEEICKHIEIGSVESWTIAQSENKQAEEERKDMEERLA